jgi:hypothetical protein
MINDFLTSHLIFRCLVPKMQRVSWTNMLKVELQLRCQVIRFVILYNKSRPMEVHMEIFAMEEAKHAVKQTWTGNISTKAQRNLSLNCVGDVEDNRNVNPIYVLLNARVKSPYTYNLYMKRLFHAVQLMTRRSQNMGIKSTMPKSSFGWCWFSLSILYDAWSRLLSLSGWYGYFQCGSSCYAY